MKIALITGAGSGIGRSIAEHLLDQGYGLFLHANSSQVQLEAWTKAHPRSSQVLSIFSADLGCAEGQDGLVVRARSILKHLDLLVNNASEFYPCPFGSISRESFHKMLGVNLEAPFFIAQGLLAELSASKDPSVINILDAMWERPSINFSSYAISKGGLAIATRALAKELAPHIRVNGIAPGAMAFNRYVKGEEAEREVLDRIPFGRLGCGKDIALAVEFLTSSASYVTGEIINIDGGRSIY